MKMRMVDELTEEMQKENLEMTRHILGVIDSLIVNLNVDKKIILDAIEKKFPQYMASLLEISINKIKLMVEAEITATELIQKNCPEIVSFEEIK
jgi:hypothetical protein